MDSLQKFQDLLKKLFQFESSDLDFRIYNFALLSRARFIIKQIDKTYERKRFAF